jgi:glycosyltransferase involved in cell wall biosynthesis
VEVAGLWPIVEMDGAGPNPRVVVSTQDEAANVLEFVRRLEYALTGEAEIVFVDDSGDETPDIIRQTGLLATIPIRLIHRPPEQRRDGLSGAVVEGLRVAGARHVCAIDVDLQHPPELLPQMLPLSVDEDCRRASPVQRQQHGCPRGAPPPSVRRFDGRHRGAPVAAC